MKDRMVVIWLIGIVVFTSGQDIFAKGWEYQKSGVHSDLTAVSFVDSEHGWAVGENGTVLATSDGGLNWKILRPSILDEVPAAVFPYTRMCHFQSVYFIDERNGWVAGEMDLPSVQPEDIAPIPVQFGVIFRTRDGGQTWECQYPCKVWTDIASEIRPFLKHIDDVFFLDARQGWAVGDGFYYLATEDGGDTWKERPIGFWAIPETRQNLTATRWISSQRGWVAGYQYDMFAPERRGGFIAHTEDGGETWEMDPFYPLTFAPVPALMDLEIIPPDLNSALHMPLGWSVGEQGAIFRSGPEGWELQGFPWPVCVTWPCIPKPNFNAVRFVDDRHGWIVGSREQPFGYDSPDKEDLMTLFHTADGGENWKHFAWNDPGVLNDVNLIGGTDAWAVGEQGVIQHYENHAPEICRLWAEPHTVYAGESVELYVSVKDLDGPSDIQEVTVDARSIGGGMIVLERAWQDPDERRCVLYKGEALVSPLAAYGSHRLPAEAVDYDGARDFGNIELFIITSWVEIKKTWAIPNPVAQGGKVMLAAEVGIVAPKGPDGEEIVCPYNQVEKVTVDITELLGVDCTSDMDCIIIVEMTDPDGDGVYTYIVDSVTGGPGKYDLPVWAIDTLGHEAKANLHVLVGESPRCRFDLDQDADVDGVDLARFAEIFPIIDGGGVNLLRLFAGEYGRTDCPLWPRIEGYGNSGCLPGSPINTPEDQYPWCGEDRIEVTVENDLIHITHKNATYNCCPEDIKVSLSADGNVLMVTEEEIGGVCNCLCCYDVKSTITGLTSGMYVLEYCWYDYETGEKECHTEEIILP